MVGIDLGKQFILGIARGGLIVLHYVARVFELACKESITICNASYLYYPIQNRLMLVTDDKELLERARRYVNAIRSRDLAQHHGC